jgi:3-oxoacyl-[acyl-carrier-protein] synthase-3
VSVVHEKQTCSDLCFVAAERLLAHKSYAPDTIDALIFVTQTPDYVEPATAHILHKRLGLRQDCIAFDINFGCSGHTFGLHVAASMLGHGNMKRILLLTGDGDRFNPVLPINERLLFGHAGSARFIETGAGRLRTSLSPTARTTRP